MKLNEAKKKIINKTEFNDAINDFTTVDIMRVFIQVLDKYNLVDVKVKKSLMNDARSMDAGTSTSKYFIDDTPIDIRLSGKSGMIMRIKFEPKLNKLHYNVSFIYNKNGKSEKQELSHIMNIEPIHTTNKTVYDVFNKVIKFLLPIIKVDPGNMYDYFSNIRKKKYSTKEYTSRLSGIDLILHTLLRIYPIFKKNYTGYNSIEIEPNSEYFYNRITKPINDAGLDLGVYLDEWRFAFQRKGFLKFFNILVDRMKKMDYYVTLVNITPRYVRIEYNYFKDGKNATYTRITHKKNNFGEIVQYQKTAYGKGDSYFKQYIVKEFNRLKNKEHYSSKVNNLNELEAYYMASAWKIMEKWGSK